MYRNESSWGCYASSCSVARATIAKEQIDSWLQGEWSTHEVRYCEHCCKYL